MWFEWSSYKSMSTVFAGKRIMENSTISPNVSPKIEASKSTSQHENFKQNYNYFGQCENLIINLKNDTYDLM
jgi:hypothetical protein